MAVRVPPTMSPTLSSSIAEVAAMSDSAFRKRFRSSYDNSPSSSPPDLPLRKLYRGTSKLLEDDKKEEDDEEEDEEIEKSLDSYSENEGAKDEGPTVEDEDLAAGDEGLTARNEAVGEPLGLGYRALRPHEIASRKGQIPSVFEVDLKDGKTYIDVPSYALPEPPIQTPPSLEWSSGTLHVFLAPSIVPSPFSSPMIPLTIPSPVASPAMAETEGFLRELFTRSKVVKDEIFCQRYRFRRLKLEHERVVVTFRAIWRLVLALESWVEERRARLDLAEIVDSMRRGQEPRGDV
nr:hypothetical protein [Tanacetum cinerariifolium]